MSFPVALQSAVFYILACTPCAKVRHRHKTKQKAKREREEKTRLEAAQPDMYHHPDPFNTNPYWAEEIMMGPSLPKKGGKSPDAGSKNPSQRRLTSPGSTDGAPISSMTRSSIAISNPGTSNGHAGRSPSLGPIKDGPELPPPSSPTAVPEEGDAGTITKTLSTSTGDDWNRKRYQREDEELWGHEPLTRTGHKLMDAIKQAGTSAGRYVEQRLGFDRQVTEEDRHNFYYPAKNPPVNDYHPPVVSSKPAHQDGHRWMLQPPPPAKVMEGKIPVSRSGSMMSVGSRRTIHTSEGPGLSRLVGEKAVEARIRKSEASGDGEANRPRSRRTMTGSTARTRSQRMTRDRSLSASAESEEISADEVGLAVPRRRRASRRTSTVVTPEVSTEAEDEYISKSLESLSNTVVPAYAAQRPKLSTILSSDLTKSEQSVRSDENVPGFVSLPEAAGKGNADLKQILRDRVSPTSIDSGLALQA